MANKKASKFLNFIGFGAAEDGIEAEDTYNEEEIPMANNNRRENNYSSPRGYAARDDYGYKWAEVLDADAFGLFQETGIFNKDTARRFRKEILEKGGKIHPKTLYKNYRHRAAKIDALLKRDGIIK